jgi:hypothetical protein
MQIDEKIHTRGIPPLSKLEKIPKPIMPIGWINKDSDSEEVCAVAGEELDRVRLDPRSIKVLNTSILVPGDKRSIDTVVLIDPTDRRACVHSTRAVDRNVHRCNESHK